MSRPRLVHVAVAVIRDEAGRVLVAQRLPHQHLAGLWEFPGGKLEPGETLAAGMRREIREELAIEVEALLPLLRIEHSYPEKTVLLDVWRVVRWSGAAPATLGAEGQPLRWVHPDDMVAGEFPPADVPIIAALRLPPRYVISPELADLSACDDFVAAVERQGVQMVQVRLKQHAALAPVLVERLRARLPQARILINSDTLARWPVAGLGGADGVHLTSTALALAARGDGGFPAQGCRAASCHDAAELAQAYALGLDFVTLSPVQVTTSHADAPALGWEKFANLAAGAGLPVYALGGMRADSLPVALAHGAVGIAGISALLD